MFFTVTVKTRDTVKTSGTQMLDNSEELTDHHKVEEDQRRIEVWEGERGGAGERADEGRGCIWTGEIFVGLLSLLSAS